MPKDPVDLEDKHVSDLFWELANEFFIVVDFEGRFVRLNPQWKRTFGWDIDALVGQRWAEYLHPDDVARTMKEAAHVADGSETRFFRVRGRTRDGDYRWMSFSARSSRRTGHIYAAGQDLTGAMELQESRRRNEEQAHQLSFLREMAAFHERMLRLTRTELRAPLEPIRLQLEVLKDTSEETHDPALERALHVMYENLQRLEGVVTEIMEAERIREGTMRLADEAVDVDLLVHEVVGSFREPAELARIQVAAKAATGCWVDGDVARLRLALAHLVSNAVKFTRPAGRVTVEAHDEGDTVAIVVRDDGIGMTPRQVDALFHPFTPVHDPSVVAGLGNGLGLYLTKGIVEGHGGTVTVASEGPGKGTTCRMTLPRRHAQEPAPSGRKDRKRRE